MLVTILFQQVPYFQRHQPEGLCMATYMTVVSCCSLFVTLAYCYAHIFHRLLPTSFMIPVLLVTTFFGTIFSALTYHYTVANSSLYLLIALYLGAAVGSLQSVILNPFMTKYENLYISCARGGASLCYVVSSLLSIAQSPGDDPRFGPKIFLLIFSVILFFPMLAYREILSSGIGLKIPSHTHVDEYPESAVEITNALHLADSTNSSSQVKEWGDECAVENEDNSSSISRSDCEASWLMWLVPREHRSELLPHMAAVGLVQFVTWGLLQSAMPFAFDFVMAPYSGSGSFYLAIAYEIGADVYPHIVTLVDFTTNCCVNCLVLYVLTGGADIYVFMMTTGNVGLVAGDLSTAFVSLHIPSLLVIFVTCATLICLTALHLAGMNSSQHMAGVLVALFSCCRFIEAHTLTSTYRTIASTFPPRLREQAARSVGVADQVCFFLGTAITSTVVFLLVSC